MSRPILVKKKPGHSPLSQVNRNDSSGSLSPSPSADSVWSPSPLRHHNVPHMIPTGSNSSIGSSLPHHNDVQSRLLEARNPDISASMQQLLGNAAQVKSIHSIVKNRTGSVLSRKTILKSDHYDTAFSTDVDYFLQGAPNFRSIDLSIYGVGQPTISGLSTVLTLLNCNPASGDDHPPCLWFSSREEPMVYINQTPFVLRDEDVPLENIKRYQGINSSRLEQMEARLKEDILAEVRKNDGLLLVHDEIGTVIHLAAILLLIY